MTKGTSFNRRDNFYLVYGRGILSISVQTLTKNSPAPFVDFYGNFACKIVQIFLLPTLNYRDNSRLLVERLRHLTVVVLLFSIHQEVQRVYYIEIHSRKVQHEIL